MTAIVVILAYVFVFGFFHWWVLPRYGSYTIDCLVFRNHKRCDQHLRCGCPHHDAIIHQEMAKH